MPPAIEVLEPGPAFHEVERRPFLRAHLGQDERAFRKIEGRDGGAASDLRASFPPVEPARDHQVENQEELPFELEDDTFSETPEAEHPPPLGARERR